MNAPQTQAAPTQDGTTFGLSNSTLARLGLVGGLGLLGAAKSKQEAKATDAAIAQQKALHNLIKPQALLCNVRRRLVNYTSVYAVLSSGSGSVATTSG